jgi:hypothetical protein
MNKYPRMTDSEAWSIRFRAKYRSQPTWVLYVDSLLLFPFAFICWCGQHFEAIQDVLDERP